MNTLSPFIFDSTLVIRTLERDGDPWFVAVDICNALGIQNTTQAVESLDEDERITVSLTDGNLDPVSDTESSLETSPVSETDQVCHFSGNDPIPNIGSKGQKGGPRALNIVSESGVYALIFRSNKPEAKRFRKWITSEVIPAIRKTGSYILADGSETAALLKETEDTMARLKERRDALNLELRRLDKRRRRLGGEPLRLPGGNPYGTQKITEDDILNLIPPDGIRVSPLERLTRERFQVAHGTFYRHWRQILKTERVHREGVLVFRA